MAHVIRTISARRSSKKPALRAFHGLSGSHLATVSKISSQPIPKNPPTDIVLVHFCFDQERGDIKSGHCNCTLRVSKAKAYDLIDAKQADFLLVKNPKTDKLTKFHRAIVVRRMIVAGETLFALAPPVTPDRRDAKHEAIKAQIKSKARGILQKLFSLGIISQQEASVSDTDLETALHNPKPFLERISARKRMQEDWREVALYWWNNILGFHRLNIDAGKFLNDSDHAKGLAVMGGVNTAKLDQLFGTTNDPRHDADACLPHDTGKVIGGSGKASYWNGGWDHSTGCDPQSFEAGEIGEE